LTDRSRAARRTAPPVRNDYLGAVFARQPRDEDLGHVHQLLIAEGCRIGSAPGDHDQQDPTDLIETIAPSDGCDDRRESTGDERKLSTPGLGEPGFERG
jgi:hypothetical protein